MSAPNPTDAQYRAQGLLCLAHNAARALGVECDNPSAATILEHTVYQACAELEALQEALERLNETSVLVSVVAGIRLRLELANDSGDLLAELLAAPAACEVAE